MKELTPFIQMRSNILSHIDEKVKTDLKIKYKDVEVNNLQQLQFLIVNTGEKSIKGIINPLTLCLPDNTKIMDYSVVYIHPEGRDITTKLSVEENKLEFNFNLLNKDEFFIVKLLVKGTPSRKELLFTIEAEDLPPKLSVKPLPYNHVETKGKSEKRKLELPLVIIGITFCLIGFIVSTLAHYCPNDIIPKITTSWLIWLNYVPNKNICRYILHNSFHIFNYRYYAFDGWYLR